MFERVQFNEWQAIITIAAFILCFSAFIYFCWRALNMKRGERDRMSSFPLENDED